MTHTKSTSSGDGDAPQVRVVRYSAIASLSKRPKGARFGVVDRGGFGELIAQALQ